MCIRDRRVDLRPVNERHLLSADMGAETQIAREDRETKLPGTQEWDDDVS